MYLSIFPPKTSAKPNKGKRWAGPSTSAGCRYVPSKRIPGAPRAVPEPRVNWDSILEQPGHDEDIHGRFMGYSTNFI